MNKAEQLTKLVKAWVNDDQDKFSELMMESVHYYALKGLGMNEPNTPKKELGVPNTNITPPKNKNTQNKLYRKKYTPEEDNYLIQLYSNPLNLDNGYRIRRKIMPTVIKALGRNRTSISSRITRLGLRKKAKMLRTKGPDQILPIPQNDTSDNEPIIKVNNPSVLGYSARTIQDEVMTLYNRPENYDRLTGKIKPNLTNELAKKLGITRAQVMNYSVLLKKAGLISNNVWKTHAVYIDCRNCGKLVAKNSYCEHCGQYNE